LAHFPAKTHASSGLAAISNATSQAPIAMSLQPGKMLTATAPPQQRLSATLWLLIGYFHADSR
jgi:hypothetical protein